MGSRIEASIPQQTVVVKETTAAGMRYLEDRATNPHCVLTDHNPPAQDCFELLDAVPPELPVVLTPTEGSSSLATKALSAGAATYIDPTAVENSKEAIATGIDRAVADSVSDPVRHIVHTRIEEFSSVVSHELRSPIQTAKSGLDLARAECESRYLDDVDETLTRLNKRIDNVMQLLNDDEAVPELEPIDLAVIVDESWPDQSTATLSVETDLPRIEAEESRLRQLLENLFRNATEHGGADSSVRVGVIDHPVRSSATDSSIGLYIADDGPGIERDQRESVFEYGYTGSEDGTGLGLAIVSEVVESFGWEITVTDSNAGGARFEIYQINTI